MLVVVALGGNAIQDEGSTGTVVEQRHAIRAAARGLCELVATGHQLVVTHGNGPQVGGLLLQQRSTPQVAAMPLDVLVAQTQGQLGYLIGQELAMMLRAYGLEREVLTVLTQVLVDPQDPGFARPDKPVGPRYTPQELERLTGVTLPAGAADTLSVGGVTYALVGPDSWRRVVPSPQPLDVLEASAITAVVERGGIPVCGGGGGIPVTRVGGSLCGVEAVVDKDRTAALLTRLVGADALLILTDVERVMLGYGTAAQRPLDRLTPAEAAAYLSAGEFPAGSMGPKVAAAADVASRGGMAMIGALAEAVDVLEGRAGTCIAA